MSYIKNVIVSTVLSTNKLVRYDLISIYNKRNSEAIMENNK